MSKKVKKSRKKSERPNMMDSKEYVQAVTRLKRSIRAASKTLGVALRQSQRFASGETPVPVPVQKLLRLATQTRTSARKLERL